LYVLAACLSDHVVSRTWINCRFSIPLEYSIYPDYFCWIGRS